MLPHACEVCIYSVNSSMIACLAATLEPYMQDENMITLLYLWITLGINVANVRFLIDRTLLM